MHQYRVTKYDPAYRDELGCFTGDDWTSFCDIGSVHCGSVLSLAEYKSVEDAYVESALDFMGEAGIQSLSARGVENYGNLPFAPAEGAELEGAAIASVVRSILRDEFWCRLDGDASFVHFGYDYYMYVGVVSPCDGAIAGARNRGLFVEPFESPHTPPTEIRDATCVSKYIGTMVSLTIDRPLGSKHPQFETIYPINYGFVPGTISGDGEELDAYVLGVDKACSTFRGRCVAAIIRDEDDPKLVVIPDGCKRTDDEIRSATHFQEQYFGSRIIR